MSQSLQFDAPMREVPLGEVAAEAVRYERMGFDGVWTFDTGHDPFLPLGAVATATDTLEMGTNIAVAFARSPFSMAQVAWDLQAASGGRLHLGLGTQVRAHVERRFSMPFEHPAARITDYIHCLRAIWNTFQTGARPAYEGRFYRFTLINDFFNPGPIEHPAIPVWLAGVNERMCRAAGEAADGFQVHPMHSPGYLRDVVRPAIDAGARGRGKTVEDVALHAPVFVVSGATEAERAKVEAGVRRQVAFYASTPSYRAVLEYHDLPDLGKRLSAMMREGRLDEMPGAVPDALLDAVAVSGNGAALGRAVRERYAGGIVQRVSLYQAVPPASAEDEWQAIAAEVKA